MDHLRQTWECRVPRPRKVSASFGFICPAWSRLRSSPPCTKPPLEDRSVEKVRWFLPAALRDRCAPCWFICGGPTTLVLLHGTNGERAHWRSGVHYCGAKPVFLAAGNGGRRKPDRTHGNACSRLTGRPGGIRPVNWVAGSDNRSPDPTRLPVLLEIRNPAFS